MKKIQRGSKGSHFPSVNLFKDDLVKIIELLSEVCEIVEISDDEYEYESLEELQQTKGLTPKKISISGRNPNVSIDLKQRGSWLYRISSDQQSIYAYKGIEDIFVKKRNIIGRLFNRTVGVIFFIFFAVTSKEIIINWFPDLVQRIMFVVLLMGVPIISFCNEWGFFSYITLKKSHEEFNFFERNKDDIIKIIIGAVIGALITWALTKFFGK
ncbi:MAG: hypothetical protein AB7U85_11110 [Alphaproteobacteria bacterium]